MKVNSNISFKGVYDNKILKKGLEFAADNGAKFSAATVLGFSFFIRPASIMLTPNVDKENKQAICTKSILSSVLGYLFTWAVSDPLAGAIKKIDAKPDKYLKADTIKTLRNGSEKLYQSKSYSLATQMFKLGVGLLIAAPKAILTSKALPFAMNEIFRNNKNDETGSKNLAFKGKSNDKLAKGIGRILNKKGVQEFSNKYKDTNFPMHIIALTDILATSTFIYQTRQNRKINEKRKEALVYNAAISTFLSVASSYWLDKLTEKPTERFIEKFKEVNKLDPKLDKQVEGIKIAKPILLMGCVYYILIPFISTFLADKAEQKGTGKTHSAS